VYERALRLLLDTLGEQHPVTAITLQNMGVSYGYMGSHDIAIMLYKRALQIFHNTIGLHPRAAVTMTSMGLRYSHNGQNEKAIELFEQVLRIFEHTVGRMHEYTAGAIQNMSTTFFRLGDLLKAEKLILEAVAIREKTVGHDHERTVEARKMLHVIVQKSRPEEFRDSEDDLGINIRMVECITAMGGSGSKLKREVPSRWGLVASHLS
jgi:tetratricopeptide (TPR) repeat protein